jgi:hypothetical protein
MGPAPAPPPPPSPAAAAAAAAAATTGLSKGKRTFAGALALTAAVVAGIHLNQRWEREVRWGARPFCDGLVAPPRARTHAHAVALPTPLKNHKPLQHQQGMTAGPRRDAEQYEERLRRLREEGLLPAEGEGGGGGR